MDGLDYLNTFRAAQSDNLTRFESYDIGCDGRAVRATVDDRWMCPTSRVVMLVDRPRHEYLTNLYHAMEEVYSLFQTARLVRTPLEQVELHIVGAEAVAPFARQLFETVVRRVVLTPAWTPCRCCRVVTPLRACQGSYLPLSWSQRHVGPDRLSLQIVAHVTRHMRPPEPDERVLLMTRADAHSRRLAQPWLARCPARGVRRFEHLRRVTMLEQVHIVRRHRILLGPHGAGLTHVLFLAPGGHLIEISHHDPARFRHVRSVANIYKNMAEWSGHQYTHVHIRRLSCAAVTRALLQTRHGGT